MQSHRISLRWFAVFVACLAAGSLAGCGYVSHRYHDALDMFDIGLTFTPKASFAAYKACAGLAAAGYGRLDGYFVGLGGGRIGITRFQHESVGYGLWGKYRNDFKQAADAGPVSGDAGGFEKTGLLAAADGETTEASCVQQLHLGWVGVIFNINWTQILDFFVGWTTADICHDDGKPRGGWGADDAKPKAVPETAQRKEKGETEPCRTPGVAPPSGRSGTSG